MSPRAPSPPPRASICTAGARKDCFSGVLPAAGLGVVPTKQSIAEQARAKSTQASTREAERAMLQVLPHRELHRSGLQRGQAEAKIIAESDVNTNSIGTTHWHPCMFWIGNYQPRSPKYLTSCDAHMWSSPTNNISPSPKWDSFGWIFCSPNKHALKPGVAAIVFVGWIIFFTILSIPLKTQRSTNILESTHAMFFKIPRELLVSKLNQRSMVRVNASMTWIVDLSYIGVASLVTRQWENRRSPGWFCMSSQVRAMRPRNCASTTTFVHRFLEEAVARLLMSVLYDYSGCWKFMWGLISRMRFSILMLGIWNPFKHTLTHLNRGFPASTLPDTASAGVLPLLRKTLPTQPLFHSHQFQHKYDIHWYTIIL